MAEVVVWAVRPAQAITCPVSFKAEDVVLEDVKSTAQPPRRVVQHIVTAIDYNARGQRNFIQFGNSAGKTGMRTTFRFDPQTFRLLALKTENSGKKGAYQDLEYAYDPSGNITAIQDSAQETTYFYNQQIEPEARYVYDLVYRLIEARGREHAGQNLPP